MTGRARGAQTRIIALAHQTELMARQEKLKPLAHYLQRGQRGGDTRNAANAEMVAMFERMAAQGKRVKISRIPAQD